MKKEMTREAVEAISKCGSVEYSKCEKCAATKICDYTYGSICKRLASALLDEMDKPKVDVWKDAPEWASAVWFVWTNDKHTRSKSSITYTRELPKTRIDKIVEEVIDGRLFGLRMEKSELAEMLKSALEKYAAELKGEE